MAAVMEGINVERLVQERDDLLAENANLLRELAMTRRQIENYKARIEAVLAGSED